MLNFLGKAVTGMALNGIALGALGWVVWDASMRGFPGSMTPDPAGLPALEGPAQRSLVAIEAIIGAHLFGREQTRPVAVAPTTAPATRLDLKLAGVIAMGSDRGGLALIGVGRGQQQVVRVGEGIGATGAMLVEVRRDHILIERNGRLEKLSIERPALESRPAGAIHASRSDGFSATLDDDTANLPMPSPVTFDTLDTTRSVEVTDSPDSHGSAEFRDSETPAADDEGDDPRPPGLITLPF